MRAFLIALLAVLAASAFIAAAAQAKTLTPREERITGLVLNQALNRSIQPDLLELDSLIDITVRCPRRCRYHYEIIDRLNRTWYWERGRATRGRIRVTATNEGETRDR